MLWAETISKGYLFTDLETGGLEPTQNPIVQLAAIMTDSDLNIRSMYTSFVNPRQDQIITQESIDTHHLTREKLESAPSANQVYNSFFWFAHSYDAPLIFAGYKCFFDYQFLEHLRIECGTLSAPYVTPWLDILRIARRELNLPDGHKLTTVAQHLGCFVDGAHDALADIYMTLKIARILRDTETYRNFCAGGFPQIMAKASACKKAKCGRRIVWMKTTKDKKCPVDAHSVHPGDELYDPKLHVCHFDTCGGD